MTYKKELIILDVRQERTTDERNIKNGPLETVVG